MCDDGGSAAEVQSLIEQIHDSVLLWEADLPMLSTLRENWRTETPDTRSAGFKPHLSPITQ